VRITFPHPIDTATEDAQDPIFPTYPTSAIRKFRICTENTFFQRNSSNVISFLGITKVREDLLPEAVSGKDF